MTTPTEQPTVAVAMRIEIIKARNEAEALLTAIRIGNAMLETFPEIVSVTSKPVSTLTPREDAPPPAPRTLSPRCPNCNRTRYEHHDHAHEELTADGKRCPFGDCGSYQEPAQDDDDERAHLIAVLRDDAEALDRITRRHRDNSPDVMHMLMLRDMAHRLRAQADRLKGDSA